MNVGKTLFAQVMDFVPRKTFGRIVQRRGGDTSIRTLSCADLFRAIAFSHFMWRESLHDIEVFLGTIHAKLFHMGIKIVPVGSTLVDALNQNDW